jgi:predicted nuclease of predicted toxin-antitoxin system
VNILIDAQLPPSLARMLMSAGHQARHVREVGLRNATDRTIWDYAVRERAVIVTKDEDFALRRLHVSDGPTIVWLRIGNSSTSALQRRLMPLLPEIERMATMGDVVIEVRWRC